MRRLPCKSLKSLNAEVDAEVWRRCGGWGSKSLKTLAEVCFAEVGGRTPYYVGMVAAERLPPQSP